MSWQHPAVQQGKRLYEEGRKIRVRILREEQENHSQLELAAAMEKATEAVQNFELSSRHVSMEGSNLVSPTWSRSEAGSSTPTPRRSLMSKLRDA